MHLQAEICQGTQTKIHIKLIYSHKNPFNNYSHELINCLTAWRYVNCFDHSEGHQSFSEIFAFVLALLFMSLKNPNLTIIDVSFW